METRHALSLQQQKLFPPEIGGYFAPVFGVPFQDGGLPMLFYTLERNLLII